MGGALKSKSGTIPEIVVFHTTFREFASGADTPRLAVAEVALRQVERCQQGFRREEPRTHLGSRHSTRCPRGQRLGDSRARRRRSAPASAAHHEHSRAARRASARAIFNAKWDAGGAGGGVTAEAEAISVADGDEDGDGEEEEEEEEEEEDDDDQEEHDHGEEGVVGR